MTRSDSLLAQAAMAEGLLEPDASGGVFEDVDIEDRSAQSHDDEQPAPVRRAYTWFCAHLMSEWTSCYDNLFQREQDRQDLKRARRCASDASSCVQKHRSS